MKRRLTKRQKALRVLVREAYHITMLWWYPKIFNDDRMHWNEFKMNRAWSSFTIDGYFIAYRYYRLENDNE